jgi:hypothetical protein
MNSETKLMKILTADLESTITPEKTLDSEPNL